jgi:hypothetical protein
MAQKFRFRIADPKGLGEELQREVDRRFGGNKSAAADAAGLKQPHFTRLLAGKYEAITVPTGRALRDFLPEDRLETFYNLIMGEGARSLLASLYRDWIKEATNRAHWAAVPMLFKSEDDEIHFVDDLDALFWNRFGFHVEMLKECFLRFPSYLAPLNKAIEEGGYSLARKSVSLARIFEPLLDHYNSGFVERGWHELSDDEKMAFLDASVRREVILLDRDPTPARASAVFYGRKPKIPDD